MNNNTNKPTATNTTTTSVTGVVKPTIEMRLPGAKTLQNASKLAITEDKPIMMDYWNNSLNKDVIIGVKVETKEKLLVKNEEEYTSPISNIYKVEKEYIIITENSIYIIDNSIDVKPISN